VAVDLNTVTEATLGQDGQIILTGEDGHGKTVFYRLCTVAGQELLEQ
jgi:tRNA A37 threonylcarbamoyladenosine biosynthesis protein TsaE